MDNLYTNQKMCLDIFLIRAKSLVNVRGYCLSQCVEYTLSKLNPIPYDITIYGVFLPWKHVILLFVFSCNGWGVEQNYFFLISSFPSTWVFLGYKETLFILLVAHIFSNFAPTSAKKLLYKQSKNQRGDPWMKKYFFFKNCLQSF